MLMAISFPDTESSAAQFSDAASRLDTASRTKSSAVSTGHECGACPGRKAVQSNDEDFEGVLAWMMSGIVTQIHVPATPDTTDTASAPVPVATATVEISDSFRLGQVPSAGGAAAPHKTEYASYVPSEDAVAIPEALSDTVHPGLRTVDASTTMEVIADNSSNDDMSSGVGESFSGDSTPIRSQSVLSNAHLQSMDGVEFLPSSLSFSSDTAIIPVQPDAVSTSEALPSSPSATPAALSQDAIDALARIGRFPDPTIYQASVSALPRSGSPSPASPASALSVTTVPMVTDSESDRTESSMPSVAVTPDQGLTLSPESVGQPLSVPVASENVETMIRPVRGRTSSASAVQESSAFPPGREPHSAVAWASDMVRSESVQPPTAHPLPDLAVSISSEMRQPLSNQVSQALMEHIERNGARQNDSLTVRLDPPELGEMTIELSKTHEGLAVRVTAREAVTMDMLFARGQEIESHLRGQQMNLKSLEFLQADMSGNQFSQGQQQSDPSRRSGNSMNQMRRASRSSGPANVNFGRIAAPDSAYGLSFRA